MAQSDNKAAPGRKTQSYVDILLSKSVVVLSCFVLGHSLKRPMIRVKGWWNCCGDVFVPLLCDVGEVKGVVALLTLISCYWCYCMISSECGDGDRRRVVEKVLSQNRE